MTHNKQYEADIEPLRFVVPMQALFNLSIASRHHLILFHVNNKDADRPQSSFCYIYYKGQFYFHRTGLYISTNIKFMVLLKGLASVCQLV